jgi:hypothetical protein
MNQPNNNDKMDVEDDKTDVDDDKTDNDKMDVDDDKMDVDHDKTDIDHAKTDNDKMDINDDKTDVDDDKTNTVDMFLWVSHGGNVSSNNTYFPVETKFNSIILYSRPFEILTAKKLRDMFDREPCRFILGTCPKIPILNKENNKKYCFLPPITFENDANEQEEEIKQLSGLYFLRITYFQFLDNTRSKILKRNKEESDFKRRFLQFKDSGCKLEYEKMVDHQELIDKYGSRTKITYSQIFQLVLEKCALKNLKPENILLGIASCQIQNELYVSGYEDFTISNLIPKHINKEISFPKIIGKTGYFFYLNYYISPTIIPLSKYFPRPWQALAQAKHQGCGLNVLSYFYIIKETEAREKTVCLNIKGQTIFNILEYLYKHFKEGSTKEYKGEPRMNEEHKEELGEGFLIIRYDFVNAIKVMLNFLHNFNPNYGYALFFKMYNDNKIIRNGKTIVSHIGHTVALYKGRDLIFYIDPQSSVTQQIDNMKPEAFKQLIDSLYPSNKWKFIDLIFTVKKDFSSGRPKQLLKTYMSDPNSISNIIDRTPDLMYGGKKTKNRNTKNRNTKKNSKKKNKCKSIKKRKTKIVKSNKK